MNFISKTLCFSASTFLLVYSVNAETKLEIEPTPLPQTGTLSSIGEGSISKSVDNWVDPDIKGNASAPISASVSKSKKGGNWVVRVFNNSEDIISVNLSVNQYNARGTKVKSDPFSYTLSPSENAEREVFGASGVVQALVELKGWKAKKIKPKEPMESAPSAE